MKRMLAIIAALLPLFISSPLLAQETETLPDGRKVRIIHKDGATIIEEVKEGETDETEDLDEVLPAEVRELIKRLREKAEKADEEGDWEDVEEEGVKIRIRGFGEGELPAELPEEVRKAMEEMRERFKKMHEELQERMKKMREEFEKNVEEWENDPDAEVEEYEKTSPDGSSTVKIKIVRIRKSSHSEDSTPEAPKKDTERKQ
ncbi:MAG: hypothetical protein H6841_07090 [Planctomycetes bacterium]|nr:hypothetical protein [Planctomycetota bacterium]MCB9935262.1 hypothetical protein [Planctomycetota bacterium]